MNNIGASEIFVLFLLGLIVFGPNKLPEIARNLGKALRSFRSETEKAAKTLRDAVDEPKRQVTSAGVFDTADTPAPAPIAPLSNPPSPPTVNQADFDVLSANGSEPDPEIEPAARELEDT